MIKKYKFLPIILFPVGLAIVLTLLVQGSDSAVLNPQGVVAAKQRDLIVIATLLMAAVVVPVLTLTFFIAWRYREGNTKAAYTPEWDSDGRLEALWWGIPFVLIFALSVMIWTSSHELDPRQALASNKRPISVQVIALQWKWLFIYPEQNIATVNYVQFPKDTPVNFSVTSDGPMNSFWIPSLGGQIYAMAGMGTQLNLMADGLGSFRGSSANLSGEGFSAMRFTADATSQADFETWVQSVKQSPQRLDMREYEVLTQPGVSDAPMYYSSKEPFLYDKVIMKYMMPVSKGQGTTLEAAGKTPYMQNATYTK